MRTFSVAVLSNARLPPNRVLFRSLKTWHSSTRLKKWRADGRSKSRTRFPQSICMISRKKVTPSYHISASSHPSTPSAVTRPCSKRSMPSAIISTWRTQQSRWQKKRVTTWSLCSKSWTAWSHTRRRHFIWRAAWLIDTSLMWRCNDKKPRAWYV